MVRGWRRVFCTSIPEDTESQESSEQPNLGGDADGDSGLSPNISSRFPRFGFFSRAYTQRLQSQPVETVTDLRCQTSTAETRISSSSSSPKRSSNSRKDGSPRFFFMSNPSSPKSPSGFSILKASLRFAHSRCGICSQSVNGEARAIFTAECSHSFHFSCISAHIKKNHKLICPICQSNWNEPPSAVRISRSLPNPPESHRNSSKPLKVYDDDEPLTFPSPRAHFNAIPESNENEEEEQDPTEFQGFFVNSAPSASLKKSNPIKNVEAILLPEAVVVAVDRSYSTYATTLKVKAPATRCVTTMSSALCRPPIDLVAVLDLSSSSNGAKLQMVKRTMRIVISSLFSSDRLSIVAFSSVSKRLQPLRSMTPSGRISALRIVDALREVGRSTCVVDVLKKASKIIEDRREQNPSAAIFLLSNGQDDSKSGLFHPSSHMHPDHLQIPVHDINVETPTDDEISRHVTDLLSLAVQGLRLQIQLESCSAGARISAVYSFGGVPAMLPAEEIRVGNLNAGEERELLIEVKAPTCSVGSHLVLSVRSTFSNPCTQQQLIFSHRHALQLPNYRGARSSSPTIERVRIFHVTIRALLQFQRLVEHNDLWAAHQVLSSARTAMVGSASSTAKEQLRRLERELSELDRRVGSLMRRRNSEGDVPAEPLTPTSAWRVAERLAKVAIMRKSINRVSDLHGFENAGF